MSQLIHQDQSRSRGLWEHSKLIITVQTFYLMTAAEYRVAQKTHHFLYTLNSSDINQFSKLSHCQNQAKICNNTITKDPTTPQVCRYTTL